MADARLYAMRFFQGRGYTPEQSAGIVGNLQHESYLRPDVKPGDGGSAHGLAQWRGNRYAALQGFAAQRGRPVNDMDTQLAFVDHELRTTEKGALARLLRANSVQDATAAMVGYERPRGWTGPGSAQAAHGWNNRFGQARETMALAGRDPGPTQATPPSKGDMTQLAAAAGRSVAQFRDATQKVAQQGQPSAFQDVGLSSASGTGPGTAPQAPPGGSGAFSDILAGDTPPGAPAAALGGTPEMLNPAPLGGTPPAMQPPPPGGLMAPPAVAAVPVASAPPLPDLGSLFETPAAKAATTASRDAAIKAALYSGPLVQTAAMPYLRSGMMG